MNFVRRIHPQPVLSVLDTGAETTAALIARKKEDGTFEVLGAGEATTRGVREGVVTHLGDAVESVAGALREAEAAAGLGVETLYFSLGDPGARSLQVRGSRHLTGEGEIRHSDVEETCRVAWRLASHFEWAIVYFKELGFVIDGRDEVANPVGVFGAKLEVIAHVVQARSRICEEWMRLFARAEVERPIRVFSGWSTVCGILPEQDRTKKRWIVDLGHDLISVLLLENGGLSDYRVFPAASSGSEKIAAILGDFSKKSGPAEELLLAGDAADGGRLERFFKNEFAAPVRRVLPPDAETFRPPRRAGLLGLLRAADEAERKSPSVKRKRGVVSQVRDRVVSYINEYF